MLHVPTCTYMFDKPTVTNNLQMKNMRESVRERIAVVKRIHTENKVNAGSDNTE